MAKVVNNVLVRENLSEIRNKIRTNTIKNFQEITPYGQSVDTDPSTVLGRWVDIIAESTYDIEEVAEYLMSAVDLDTATGTKLDDIVSIGNVQRQGATSSTVLLVVKAKPLTVIPQGSFVKNQYTSDSFTTDYTITINSVQGESGVFGYDFNVLDSADPSTTYEFTWKRDSSPNTNITISVQRGSSTLSDFVRDLASLINQNTREVLAEHVSGSILTVRTTDYNEEVSVKLSNSTISNVYQGVEATSSEVGRIPANAYSLTSIQSPVNGWLGVYNPFDANLGQSEQTDEELRTSYKERMNFGSSATVNAMLAHLYALDGVKYVSLRQNVSGQTTTIPANSFAVTILGGRRDDIAQAIFNHTPLGIQSYGSESGNAVDINDNNYTVQFNRPEYVPVAIRIALTRQAGFNDSDYNLIRQNLINYFNTFQVGSSITYSRLYSPINNVPNHFVNTLEVGLIVNGVPEFGTGNIELDFNQLATINAENIQFI